MLLLYFQRASGSLLAEAAKEIFGQKRKQKKNVPLACSLFLGVDEYFFSPKAVGKNSGLRVVMSDALLEMEDLPLLSL